eukprot:3932363-Amphidinium_carterae.1
MTKLQGVLEETLRRNFQLSQAPSKRREAAQNLVDMRQNSIIPAHVYNMDESSVELVPTPWSAWTFGKENERPHPVPGDEKMTVAVSVAPSG